MSSTSEQERMAKEGKPLMFLSGSEITFIKEHCAKIVAMKPLLPIPIGTVRGVLLLVAPGETLDDVIYRTDRCLRYGNLGRNLFDVRHEGNKTRLIIRGGGHLSELAEDLLFYVNNYDVRADEEVSFSFNDKEFIARPGDTEETFWQRHGGKPGWLN